MEKIIVQPGDVWAFFNTDCKDGKSHVIATNDEFGVSITLYEDEDKSPVFNVMCDDIVVDTEFALNERDCLETVRRIYSAYLTSAVFETLDAENESFDEAVAEYEMQQELIAEREDELDFVFEDFLNAIAPGYHPDNEELEAIKDAVLVILARDFDYQIYRPMFLEDEDGVDFFEEYPYECMVFDDEEE